MWGWPTLGTFLAAAAAAAAAVTVGAAAGKSVLGQQQRQEQQGTGVRKQVQAQAQALPGVLVEAVGARTRELVLMLVAFVRTWGLMWLLIHQRVLMLVAVLRLPEQLVVQLALWKLAVPAVL